MNCTSYMNSPSVNLLNAEYFLAHSFLYVGRNIQILAKVCQKMAEYVQFNKIFPGYQPCQLVKWRKNQCFKDRLCPRLQGTDVSGESVRVRYRPARVPRS
jgi:hypothetical protein